MMVLLTILQKILKSLKKKYIDILLNLKKNKGKGYAIRQGLKRLVVK